MSEKTTFDTPVEKTNIKSGEGQLYQPESGLFPVVEPPYHRPKMARLAIIIFGTLAAIALVVAGGALSGAPPDKGAGQDGPRFVIPSSPTPSATRSASPTATSTPQAERLTLLESTITPTPVPGGRILVLTPAARDVGWVASDDENIVTDYGPQNHFGDTFLYTGVLAGKVYHAAIQFDLGRIPRGTKIYAVSLRLTGLRADQLNQQGHGTWRVQFLSPEIDYNWRSHNYEQIHRAASWCSLEPLLTQEELGEGRVNLFEFTPEQIALLERRILEGSDLSGWQVSFRIDGPAEAEDNLFAWDSGSGPASQGAEPELFLSPGPRPSEPPTPTYVIITSTPTPLGIMTAAAEALQVTAKAMRLGTATPLPSNWVTPVVVTSTPTPANQATVEYLRAIILTTGTPTPLPGNVQTATPTPVFIAVGLFVSPTPTAAPTAIPQPIPVVLSGKILFLSDREGATEEQRLQAEKKKATPQIIPQPYVFDLATGKLGRLTAVWPYQVAIAREAWSADMAYWAYPKEIPGRRNNAFVLHYFDYRHQVEHPITNMGAGIAYDPAWSPVRDEIAFVSTESGNDEIWVINRDGSGVRQLTHNEWEWDKHPSWSPDGQQIVFFSNRTGTSQLWIMNRDGSEQRLLMDLNPYNDWDPVWVKYLEPAIPPVTPTPAFSAFTGTLTLLNPVTLDIPSYGPTDFEWRWTGPAPAGLGFEVRVWREGDPPKGAHDAVLDNQNGNIKSIGENKYRLSIDIREAAGVRGRSGEYLWTVALVQISPNYEDLGQQALPAHLRFVAAGGRSGN